jgi:hypothetical protein
VISSNSSFLPISSNSSSAERSASSGGGGEGKGEGGGEAGGEGGGDGGGSSSFANELSSHLKHFTDYLRYMNYDIFIIKASKHFNCTLARAKGSVAAHYYEKDLIYRGKADETRVYKFAAMRRRVKKRNLLKQLNKCEKF